MNFKLKLMNHLGFRKTCVFLFLLLGSVTMANAQSVSGTVSADGQPLPGASIVVKGTTKGTTTDFDGNFTIEANATSTLSISYIGYTTKEILVGNQTQINVTLEEGNKLDEVVVIGYGTQRKSDLTGSVSTVSAEDITSVPVSRVDQALQGRAAGVQVTQTSGAPGAGTSIRVRGGNSITGSNEPLWVIDGIVVGSNFNLNNINSSDIKSIEILKDASSIAIYGSRGANGVILVTTKNGSGIGGGKPQVNIGTYTSMQLVPERPKYLSQAQQIDYTNEDARFRGVAEPFPGNPSDYPDNDFFDLLLNASPIHNVDVSIAGSSENGSVNYYNSLNYFNQDGLIDNSGIKKYIFRSNIDFKLSEKLKAGFRINYSRLNQDNGVVGYGGLLNILPTQPIYNEDGSFNGFNDVIGAPFNNPVATALLDTDNTVTNNLLGTVYLEYSPIKNLIIRSTFNPEINNWKRNEFTSSQRPDLTVVGETGNARITGVSSFGWNNENTIQYTTNFGEDHNLIALGGASFQKVTTENFEMRAFGITTDATGFNNIGLGTDPTRNVVGSGYSGFQIASFFGRLNYSYKDKYLLTLVGRTDGSSVFAPGNKWEFYPSIAGAWKISEEAFMQDQDFFKDLKFRASYGKSGNQAIGPYNTLAILEEANTTLNGSEQPGLTLGRPANPDLKWETTSSLDLALEASLFGGKIFTEFNYYYKKTDDLLLNVTIPRQTGFTSQLQNVGSLQNKGWEFLINSTNIRNDNFSWNSTVTLSSNKNKVLDLGGQEFIDVVVDQIVGAGNLRIIVGETVPVFTGANYLGTWKSQDEIDASGLNAGTQIVGGPKFENINGDGIISNEDFIVLGSPFPDLIFGFENNFSYKNFDFGLYFQGTVGNEVYNLRTRGNFWTRGENPKFIEVADRWTPDNPTSDIPRAGHDGVSNIFPSSYDVEDGSHLRLKTATITYNLPIDKLNWKGVKKMSVYASGTNLLLLSNFRLIDPETSAYGSNGLGNIAQGFSNGEYPNAKVLSLGLNVTF
ncbi:SusC/RagA family TonB-linked outer membrane protein [Cellulophaga tyrosinoxydans]|uniref:TonB-linked outer membrane protein, SusC/RagA family n=1 Tax=Cellulophaga tyrosinoxydans TaxID=504486 RepID=A0A1W2C4M0_9FLAO|nr:TonB-dependent receptor [Cellulophaga tyrosinoxydans]SMC80139.1 TonB-linked outer membrane protein, SusC/RagA family [Cellulophaga tyrosinoxydans]